MDKKLRILSLFAATAIVVAACGTSGTSTAPSTARTKGHAVRSLSARPVLAARIARRLPPSPWPSSNTSGATFESISADGFASTITFASRT